MATVLAGSSSAGSEAIMTGCGAPGIQSMPPWALMVTRF